MNIVVCIKWIVDPEIPPAKFKIDPGAKKVIPPEGTPFKISPFDLQALEAALRLKEKHGATVTALTVGGAAAAEAIRYAIAMGVDDGVVLSDTSFEGSDAFGTAHILAQATKKIGACDLILCGRQAADWDLGVVGSAIGRYLGLPVITLARKVEVSEGTLVVERMIPDGYEVVQTALPAVVTVSSELGQPRMRSGKGIVMAARKKPLTWGAGDIGTDPSRVGAAAARSDLVALSLPVQKRRREMVSGEDAADSARKLMLRLREEKVI